MNHYLLFENPHITNDIINLEDFIEDYVLYYSPHIFTYYEMIFCDLIYQMVMESHLVNSEKKSKVTRTLNIEYEIFNEDKMEYEIRNKEIKKNYNKYEDYEPEKYNKKCRDMAKDIFFDLKNRKIDEDYFINKLKESETKVDYNNNILKYEKQYYKFIQYMKLSTEPIFIIVSKEDIEDELLNIIYIAF